MSTVGAPLARSGLSRGLRQRLLSAAVLVPLSVAVVFAGGWVLAGWGILLAGLMSWELARQLVPRRPWPLTAVMTLSIAIAIGLAAGHRVGEGLIALALGGITAGGCAARSAPAKSAVLGLAATLYIGAAGVAFVALRANSEAGQWLVLWLFAAVWAADTAAYVAGRSLGRHALVPALSPAKTWEGLAAAAVAGLLAGLCLAPMLVALRGYDVPVLSVGLAVVAVIGDLLESMVKRRFGVKDMSGLVPGHGGVLDRLDSLLLVLIVAGIAKAGSAWF